MYKIYISIVAIVVTAIGVNADIFNMVRINQNGDIIDGPVSIESDGMWHDRACKISGNRYIYYHPGLSANMYAYDSSLNFVGTDHTPSPTISIDNVRTEVVSGHTVTRYDSTLNIIDEFEVEGTLYHLTVDESDGSIWYSTYGAPHYLCKITHDGTPIYTYDMGAEKFSDISPTGNFWHEGPGDVELRRSSDGYVFATCNVSGLGEALIGFEMCFNDESCWFIAWDYKAVVKVNSSGSIVYNNSADFSDPYDLSVDQSDGSVWVADTGAQELIHLDQNGSELLRKDWTPWWPFDVAVDPSDGTIIVISSTEPANIKSASLGEIKAHYATDEMKGK